MSKISAGWLGVLWDRHLVRSYEQIGDFWPHTFLLSVCACLHRSLLLVLALMRGTTGKIGPIQIHQYLSYWIASLKCLNAFCILQVNLSCICCMFLLINSKYKFFFLKLYFFCLLSNHSHISCINLCFTCLYTNHLYVLLQKCSEYTLYVLVQKCSEYNTSCSKDLKRPKFIILVCGLEGSGWGGLVYTPPPVWFPL